jgi:hypothetical protein
MMMGEMPFFSYMKLWYSSYSKLLKVEEYKEENIAQSGKKQIPLRPLAHY